MGAIVASQCFLLLGALLAPQATETTVVRGATVIRVDGSPPIRNCFLAIANGHVSRLEVDSGQRVPQGAVVINARHRYIVPGLIDAHVYLSASGGSRPRLRGDDGESVRKRLAATLYCGVTGIKVVAAPLDVVTWRARVADGTWPGPRIFACGPAIVVPGQRSLPMREEDVLECGTPARAAETIALLERRGTDGVSVVLGTMDRSSPSRRARAERLLADLASAARASRPRLYVRIATANDALSAVAEGAIGIETVPRDVEVPKELLIWTAKRKCAWVSALTAYDGMLRAARSHDFPSEPLVRQAVGPRILWSLQEGGGALSLLSASRNRQRELAATLKAAQRTLRRIAVNHVTIVAGSGAGCPGAFHGPALHRELELLVEAGFTPIEALRAATVHAARYLGWDAEMGGLSPGKRADFLILRANPLDDIRATRNIAGVFVAGREIDRAKLLPPRLDP